MSTDLEANGQSGAFNLSPRTFEQAVEFSQYLADSTMVPKDFQGKPGNCLIAIQWGAEVGLKPLQALQNLAVINGRPALWGDALIALVRGSLLCEFIVETDDGNIATCRVKRRGEQEQSRTFSIDDSKQAGLHGKAGPWTQYPARMRQLRARAFALRDVFADVLRGMPMAEELIDAPTVVDMGVADEVAAPPRPTESQLKRAQTWPAEAFATQFARWTRAVEGGVKTAADILALAQTKGELTPEQRAQIMALKQKTADLPPAAEHAEFIENMDAAGGSQ